LRGQLKPGELQGHIVLVGSSAAGLMDLRASPRAEVIPGVLAHATALEQVLSGQHLSRPPWAQGLEALLLFLGSMTVGLVALGAPVRRAALVLATGLAALAGGSWFAFTAGGLLLDAINPALAMLAVFVLGGGVHAWITERRQRWLRTAFARYVSPNRVAHLVANPGLLQLGGQRQVCSFVFTDLTDFTRMMETGDPALAVAQLNEYLDGMLAIVFRHEGTLDRIVGDAIAVLFSAPVPQADHRQRALACALDMHAFAQAHARDRQAEGVDWGNTRIGVHSGEVIVGNFGGSRMFDYRALGDPVNTAARLEAANKHLGTRVCVSAAIFEACAGTTMRPVGRVLLKGKQQALEVATPEAALEVADCAPLQAYLDAVQVLRAGEAAADALAVFEALARDFPRDPLVALHLGRLRAGEASDLIVLGEK
jgi:adenylate cyclase